MNLKNNKGLSQVVTIVIFIALALVLIGIVWTVASNILGENVEKAETSQECLGLSTTPTAINCNIENLCNITVDRSSTGRDIEGVRIKFLNVDEDDSEIIDKDRNIGASETTTLKNLNATFEVGKVELTPYLRDSEGEIAICSDTKSLLNN